MGGGGNAFFFQDLVFSPEFCDSIICIYVK